MRTTDANHACSIRGLNLTCGSGRDSKDAVTQSLTIHGLQTWLRNTENLTKTGKSLDHHEIE